jgi:hypothetical protein
MLRPLRSKQESKVGLVLHNVAQHAYIGATSNPMFAHGLHA